MNLRETVEAPPVVLNRLADVEVALAQAIRGKPEVIRLSLVCLIAKGHLLIEDVPGVGKTTLAHALARSTDAQFVRLQFTSDMLPSDVIGVTVYNAHSGDFEFKRGPIFTNFLLADEINRATPKTQSALLEAMNELQVTIDGVTHRMARPFMVIATQNPVEHHGTYPLPESQLDRFLLRLRIGYPDPTSEREILRQPESYDSNATIPVLSAGDVLRLQEHVHSIRVDASIMDYILAIVERSRNHESLALGVSPRGAQGLYRATQALALLEGRDYAIPDDVKRLAIPVFGHRVMVNTRVALAQRGSAAGDQVLKDILDLIEIPL